VRHARRQKYGAVGRHDPGLVLRADTHQARHRVDELVARVTVWRDLEPVGEVLRHGGEGPRDTLIVARFGTADAALRCTHAVSDLAESR
jgi:hypothetical protein